MTRENKVRPSNIVQGHFGSPHLRAAPRMAQALEDVAEFIRGDQCEIEPHGFVLVLVGAHASEVLHIGLRTQAEMLDAAASIKAEMKTPDRPSQITGKGEH